MIKKKTTKKGKDSAVVIVIGDPHIKEKYLEMCEKFVNHVIEKVKEVNPDLVVVLGDLLDTMNIVRIQPHQLAVKFLKELGKVCPTFFIVGNHDLMDNSQYLSPNHIYTPFHGVEKITHVKVVDKLFFHTCKGVKFVMCPYVPPGCFLEALESDSFPNGDTWLDADCIFAHQEFKGAKMGAVVSENGDEWLDDYPLVISGHIHDSQKVGERVYYTGSAMQHSFSEGEKKGIWKVNFERVCKEEEISFRYELLPTCFRTKKTVTLTVEEAENFDLASFKDSLENEELRICIEDDVNAVDSFKKTKQQKKLEQAGIKVLIRGVDSGRENLVAGRGTFWDSFHRLLKEKNLSQETVKKYIS